MRWLCTADRGEHTRGLDLMVTRIGHVALRVTDLETSVAFAEEVLGLREAERASGISYLTCNERHHELQLIASEEAGCDHVGLEVATADDLDVLRDRLVAEGAPILSEQPEERGIEQALRFEAPGGHVFELFTGMARGETTRYATPAAQPRKFGHVTLKSDDPPTLEGFLSRALGFRLSDRMGKALSWMRCSSDHHGIGIVKGTPDSLHHYAFELESWATIEQAADHLLVHDRRFIYGPGRHGPGNNLFSYFVDPEGVMVEYFADLLRIDNDAKWRAGDWPEVGETINQWGPLPPADFLDYVTPYRTAAAVL
jgi:catechol 2,3-dioxygenase-like lactoylglutathione lyase family enzyme